jgi:hypothetical protein
MLGKIVLQYIIRSIYYFITWWYTKWYNGHSIHSQYVQSVSVEFAVDLELGLRLEKADHPRPPFLWPVTDVFPFKNILGWCAVVIFACEIIQLRVLGICVVTAVHALDFRRLIMKHLTNGNWGGCHAVIEIHVSDGICTFSCDRLY